MKRVSVVIVTYRSENDIYDCLASLFKWADIPREELEVIVVDNNSPGAEHMFDGIRRVYGDEIVLVNNSSNGGYGQGNNVGIRCAKAPVIMIMNPDVRLNSRVFSRALSTFAQRQNVGIYGMMQMMSESRKCGTSFNTTHMMNGYLRILLTGISNRFSIFMPSCMYVSGACFFIRRDAFEKAGLFDESIFMYGEEDDVWYRMRRIGQKTVFDASSTYIHLTEERRTDANYELKMLRSVMYVNSKYGFPPIRTLREERRSLCVLRFRQWLKSLIGGRGYELDVYREYDGLIRQMITEERKRKSVEKIK